MQTILMIAGSTAFAAFAATWAIMMFWADTIDEPPLAQQKI